MKKKLSSARRKSKQSALMSCASRSSFRGIFLRERVPSSRKALLSRRTENERHEAKSASTQQTMRALFRHDLKFFDALACLLLLFINLLLTISTAQHARPNVIGHIDPSRAQLTRASTFETTNSAAGELAL